MQKLGLERPAPELSTWREMVQRMLVPHERVRIAVVGKYTDYVDSYKSVQEALIHGGIANDVGVDIQWMSSDKFTERRARRARCCATYRRTARSRRIRRARRRGDGRGHSRTRASPACRSSASASGCRPRSSSSRATSAGSTTATRASSRPSATTPVISLMESQQHVTDMGGTMRLGAYPCRLAPRLTRGRDLRRRRGERAASPPLRGLERVSRPVRRARHDAERTVARRVARRDRRAADHPWFIGCQFHPELQSRPTRPHPLFAGFIAAAARARSAVAARRTGAVARRGRGLRGVRLSAVTRCSSSPVRACSRTTRSTCASASISRGSRSACRVESSTRRASTRRIARTPARARARARRRTRGARARPRGDRAAGSHRRAPARSVRAGGRGRRRAADPRVPLPADGSARSRGRDRESREREEGPVDASGRNARRGGQGAPERRRNAATGVRTRDVAVTERGTFFGYGDLVVDMRSFARMRDGVRRARHLRRDAQRAAPGAGRRRRERRRARIHSAARARRGRRRRRRTVSRDASRSRQRAERWAEHDSARSSSTLS